MTAAHDLAIRRWQAPEGRVFEIPSIRPGPDGLSSKLCLDRTVNFLVIRNATTYLDPVAALPRLKKGSRI